MAKAVKKEPIIAERAQYETSFQRVVDAAEAFEKHEIKGQKLLYAALEELFGFGEKIRCDLSAFENFLSHHGKSLNKVTKENPYNALVDLAFSDDRSKGWRSEISNVLRLASEIGILEPLSQWLENGGGISGRYDEAVRHFERPAAKKANRLRSSRLEMMSTELTKARVVATALPGVTLKDGFHRSLLFSEGGKTFLVDIREQDKQTTIDNYLLEIAGSRSPDQHPLATRPLYRLFRAIDLIVGTCKPAGKLQLVAMWNEVVDGSTVTKIRFLSDAYSFTNATVTLAEPLSELDGQGQLAFDLCEAEQFRELFSHDHEWHLSVGGGIISIVDDSKRQKRISLHPIRKYTGHKLRQGAKLGLRTRHFRATSAGMKKAASNLDMATALFKKANGAQAAANPTPKRLQWLSDGSSPEVGFVDAKGYSGLSYPFLEFSGPTSAIDEQMDLSLVDIAALWRTTSVYGEDLTGYIANHEVADAAFCIDHTFADGDHFEYVSPMVLGVSMSRTQVCKDYAAIAVEPTSLTQKPHSNAAKLSAKPNPTLNTPTRNYALVEKNRRARTGFPATPASSKQAFGAFVTSFLPDDSERRADRKFDFEWQLEWWRRMTDIPVHVIASNWTDEEISASSELNKIASIGGGIVRTHAQSITRNRNLCLTKLYASEYDWGILMDDDAVLMQGEKHNSSYRLFAEMAANGKSAYAGVDLFQPIFGRQTPFTKKLTAPNNPYADNHVFEKSTNLKGTMIVVRNFEKEGRDPLLIPQDFDCVGEDTYLTLQAISKGYAPMTCWNFVLDELGGKSNFAMTDAERTEKMRQGHERLVEVFGRDGLQMKSDGSHQLNKSDFTRKFWGTKKLKVTVPK